MRELQILFKERDLDKGLCTGSFYKVASQKTSIPEHISPFSQNQSSPIFLKNRGPEEMVTVSMSEIIDQTPDATIPKMTTNTKRLIFMLKHDIIDFHQFPFY